MTRKVLCVYQSLGNTVRIYLLEYDQCGLDKKLRFTLGNQRERTWQNTGKYPAFNRMTMNDSNQATSASSNIYVVYLGL